MDTPPPPTGQKAVCLIVGGEDAAGGPVRAAERRDALALARRGLEVHVLVCGPAGDRGLGASRPALEAAGVAVVRLNDAPFPAECRAPSGTPGCGPALLASNLVRYALEALHRAHCFDAVIFPCWQALGFRAVQAKRAGTAFGDVTLVVRLDDIDQRRREAEKRWPTTDDLFLDYCERYTFENADWRIAESEDLVGEARRLGWTAARAMPPRPVRTQVAAASPTATVGVTHYNLGRYLPETLDSLAEQTYSALEVLVLDDGSTCDFSRRVWEEQRRRHPRFRFIRQPNAGLGAARNRLLGESGGEFFIPVDADNLAAPHMAETFIRAMQHNRDASAMTCFFAAFAESADVRRGKFLHQYCPTGGPHPAACAFNIYGDANAVFRTADLRAAGGFVEDRGTYCHDWETFVKLVRTGWRVGVVPEYLFYYRRRPDGMAAVMTQNGTDVYPFVQRMLTTFYGESSPADAEARMLWTVLAASLLRDAGAKTAPPSGWRRVRRLLGGAVRRAAGRFLDAPAPRR